MKIVFDMEPGKCSACSACAIACMDQNDVDIEGGQKPLRKIISYETEGGDFISASLSCAHCDDAPCIAACPANCLRKDEETGLTLVDTAGCTGCRACAGACPFGAPSFIQGKMTKCDGCIARIHAGLTPACIHSCPTDALSWHWAESHEENMLPGIYKRVISSGHNRMKQTD